MCMIYVATGEKSRTVRDTVICGSVVSSWGQMKTEMLVIERGRRQKSNIRSDETCKITIKKLPVMPSKVTFGDTFVMGKVY